MEKDIEVVVAGLALDPINEQPVVILKDVASNKVMPVWIDVFAAQAIAIELDNIKPPRPTTHDLLKNALASVDVSVQKIVINDLDDNGTYYARVHLKTADRFSETGTGDTCVRVKFEGMAVEVDSRPSDAIALALRAHCPIFIASGVFEKTQKLMSGENAVREITGAKEIPDSPEDLENFLRRHPAETDPKKIQ